MESPGERMLRKNSTSDLFLEFQDSQLVFKLRRSCDKVQRALLQIQELRKEVDCLKKDGELKVKIIANFQGNSDGNIGKEREYLSTINSLRDALQVQDIEIRSYADRFTATQIKTTDQVQIEEELEKLKNRYANCQEENVILRQEVKDLNQQLRLFQEALRIRNAQSKQYQAQIASLNDQILANQKQLMSYREMKEEFQLTKAINLEKQAQIELELSKYREILNNYNWRLQETTKMEEKWYHSYSDLSNTVNHIEELRETYRIRKALK